KSSVSAALALGTALCEPRALVLLLSPSLRQSQELFVKVQEMHRALGRPLATPGENALRLHLTNHSRLISLPGTDATSRRYSGVRLLVIDEASRVLDQTYYAARPFLAASGGRLVVLSTPYGKRGWFYEEWHSERRWQRVQIRSDACSRIQPEFLRE